MIIYHGTDSQTAALNISQHGCKANLRRTGVESALTPLADRVYLTKALRYAAIYAIGGDIAGSSTSRREWTEKPTGYIFKFELSEIGIANALPDEDLVGELLWKKENKVLTNLGLRVLSSSRMTKVMDGDYNSWAFAGKKILAEMTRDVERYSALRQQLLTQCDHWSVPADLVSLPVEMTALIKAEVTPQLERDYSNLSSFLKFSPCRPEVSQKRQQRQR